MATRRQLEQLIVLAARGPMTATRFAAAMGYGGGRRRRQAATSVLRRLERAGLVRAEQRWIRGPLWYSVTSRGRGLVAGMMFT